MKLEEDRDVVEAAADIRGKVYKGASDKGAIRAALGETADVA
jgi:hypothetical protein